MVALGGGVQTRPRGVLALARGALTDVTAELLLSAVVIGRQIAAHALAAGSQVVAVGARRALSELARSASDSA